MNIMFRYLQIGIVTNISSTASNGKFTVTVEFENDGEIMLGMTAVVNKK